MTQIEIDQVISVLSVLRQSNALHMAGDNEQATDLAREARLLLVGLLQSNGVDTDKLE